MGHGRCTCIHGFLGSGSELTGSYTAQATHRTGSPPEPLSPHRSGGSIPGCSRPPLPVPPVPPRLWLPAPPPASPTPDHSRLPPCCYPRPARTATAGQPPPPLPAPPRSPQYWSDRTSIKSNGRGRKPMLGTDWIVSISVNNSVSGRDDVAVSRRLLAELARCQ